MARVHRIDLGTLAAPVRRADGTMIVEARLTRTGVFKYRNADGSERSEYRPPAQVFDAASRESFRGVPVTNDHPPEMITADNARRYSVGAVLEAPHRDGIYLVAPIAVHDAQTISDMQSGKTQVSNGYDCDLEMTSGTSPEGERYDAVQTNIVGNHLAIVHNARAGKDAAVRMDAAVMTDEPRHSRNDKDTIMDLAQALAALAAAQEKLGAATARADKAERDLENATKRADKLEGERDDAKSKFDKAEQARKDAVDGQGALVSARVELITGATRVLGARFKRADGAELETAKMADRDLKLAVIKHVTNADCANDSAGKPRSMEYIDARYDAALEQAVDSADTFREAHDVIEHGRTDAAHEDKSRTDADKAYADMVESNRNGWRKDNAPSAPAAK